MLNIQPNDQSWVKKVIIWDKEEYVILGINDTTAWLEKPSKAYTFLLLSTINAECSLPHAPKKTVRMCQAVVAKERSKDRPFFDSYEEAKVWYGKDLKGVIWHDVEVES